MDTLYLQIFILINAVLLGVILTLVFQHARAHAERRKEAQKPQQKPAEAIVFDPAIKTENTPRSGGELPASHNKICQFS